MFERAAQVVGNVKFGAAPTAGTTYVRSSHPSRKISAQHNCVRERPGQDDSRPSHLHGKAPDAQQTKAYSPSARSVAASYKPPMLVTRVRLPACAHFSLGTILNLESGPHFPTHRRRRAKTRSTRIFRPLGIFGKSEFLEV